MGIESCACNNFPNQNIEKEETFYDKERRNKLSRTMIWFRSVSLDICKSLAKEIELNELGESKEFFSLDFSFLKLSR